MDSENNTHRPTDCEPTENKTSDCETIDGESSDRETIEILPDGDNYVDSNGDVVPNKEFMKEMAETYKGIGKRAVMSSRYPHLFEIGDDSKTDESAVSVGLDEYDAAIIDIMTYLNLESKYQGAKSKEGSKKISKRYHNSNSVMRNMGEKVEAASKDFDGHLDTLVAGPKLRRAGISKESIQFEKDLLRIEFYNKYGPGKANARDRKELIKKVQPPESKRNTNR